MNRARVTKLMTMQSLQPLACFCASSLTLQFSFLGSQSHPDSHVGVVWEADVGPIEGPGSKCWSDPLEFLQESGCKYWSGLGWFSVLVPNFENDSLCPLEASGSDSDFFPTDSKYPSGQVSSYSLTFPLGFPTVWFRVCWGGGGWQSS